MIPSASSWIERILALVVLVTLVVGCAPRWQIELSVGGVSLPPISGAAWQELAKQFPAETRTRQALRLERCLAESGVQSIEALRLGEQRYAWEEIAAQSWLLKGGQVQIGDLVTRTATLEVIPPPELARSGASLMDLAPTIAGALGVRSPKMTSGRALAAHKAVHVVLVLVDGLGYRRYQEVKGKRIMPFLDGLGAPRLATSVYPNAPAVAMAAIATGTTPKRNGVRVASKRSMEVETILEVLAAAGKRSVVVEGDDLPLELRHTETVISADREGDGSDDNVLADALRLASEGMPALLWVRFQGIAEAAQASGLGSEAEVAHMQTLDERLRRLVLALPPESLVLIGSSYGLHPAHEGGRLASHESLLASDIFVPIWMVQL